MDCLAVCPLCQKLLDPRIEAHVLLPLYKAHTECLNHYTHITGCTPEYLAQQLPCCISKHILHSLLGHMVEAQDNIPPDQIWISQPKFNDIKMVRLFDSAGHISPSFI
jgi:hypothetical protein